MTYPLTTTAFATTLGVLGWSCAAHAQTANDPARSPSPAPALSREQNSSADQTMNEESGRLRIGAIGGIGFPRPLAIEGMMMAGGLVALGAEYGALPSMTIDGVTTSLWSLAGDARIFPFHGAFFVGLKAGFQHIDAATTITVGSLGSAPEDLTLDSWFVNPHVGFLWRSKLGLAWGVDAGVQIPLSSSVSSTLPLSLVPSAQSTANTLGNTVLPTVDLLRIGLLL